MAKILTTDEMLEALRQSDSPEFERCVELAETAATDIARAICRHFDVEMGDSGASFEGLDLHGTACAFYARTSGQPMPKGLAAYDPTADWEPKPENR